MPSPALPGPALPQPMAGAARPYPGSVPIVMPQMAAGPAEAEAGYGLKLEQLVRWFEEAEEASESARKAAERDRDYYDNKQLSAAELAELKRRGQPDIIINRIQTKVNYLLGYESSQRTDPRGYPRTPQDESGAEAMTDALRYLRDDMELTQVFSQVWENMLIEGLGGCEIEIEPRDDGNADFVVRQWHWDRMFFDPHSREHDFADARYFGGVLWLDAEVAEEMWPDKAGVIADTITEESRTYADRPHWKQWASQGERKRVRIVQMWHREKGQWINCIFTRAGKLKAEPSPVVDAKGRSQPLMIMQSAFIDRDNDRYGFVRALIGPQDEINKRRSKLLHEAVSNQTLGEDGAVEDVNEMKAEAAKPDGHIKVRPGLRFEFVDRTPKQQLHAELLSEAKSEIDLMGPNAAMQGKGERNASGRAILANQQGGQIEIARLFDRHMHFRRRVYRLLWDLVRLYWTGQKWIRVTDDEKNVKFVGLNRQVTMAEDLIAKRVEETGKDEAEVKAEIKQMLAEDPFAAQDLSQVVRVENVPAEMDMDVILEEVPDSANVQEEQFQILANLASAGVQFPPKVYIESSGLRNKRKLLEILEQAEAQPAQQAAAEAELQKLAAEVDKIKSEIEKNRAQATKTLVEADLALLPMGQIETPAVLPAPGGSAAPSTDPAAAPMGGFEPEMPTAPSPPEMAGFAPQPMPPPGFSGEVPSTAAGFAGAMEPPPGLTGA